MVSKAARWGFQNRSRGGGLHSLGCERLETRRSKWMGTLVLTALVLWMMLWDKQGLHKYFLRNRWRIGNPLVMSLIGGCGWIWDTEQGTAGDPECWDLKAILVGSGASDCLSSSWKTFIRSGDLEGAEPDTQSPVCSGGRRESRQAPGAIDTIFSGSSLPWVSSSGQLGSKVSVLLCSVFFPQGHL